MQFRVYDTRYPSRLYFLDDLEVQFRNHQALVPAAVAYRMSRFGRGEFVIEDKRVLFNPDAWRTERRLIWSCNVASANGFGMVAENTIRYLRSAGVNVLNPGSVSSNTVMGGEFVDQTVLDSLKTTIEPDTIEIQHCQPPAFVPGVVERSWIYTMFETTRTPKRWIKRLNETEHVLVPSSWLVDSWREQGVRRPISVYGHGIDTAVYSFIDRPERETYTFLHYGQLSTRKGTDLVFRAFTEEFRDDPHARLVLKTNVPIFPVPLHHPQVEYISATYSKEQMRSLLERSDCFVFPTRGEGFGLPPFEAMAAGLPTIVTGWSGPVDYVDPQDTLVLDYKMARAYDFDQIYHDHFEPGEDAGEWAEPSLEHLRYFMRYAYENRNKVKDMGRRTAERLAVAWSWEQKVGELVRIIDGAV